MAKLKLVAAPTFSADVGVPIAGGELSTVRMTFRHRTKTQLQEFVESRGGKSDADSFMEMVTGWDLEEPFSRESVDTLLENYGGAGLAAFKVYITELVGARLGN